MMSARGLLIVLATVLVALPATTGAHHSTSLNFSQEIVYLEGTIRSVAWVNPHCSFVLEVADESGVTEEWLVEMLARVALERQGFEFQALEVGAAVKVAGRLGYRHNSLYLREAQLPDGRVLTPPGPIR